MQSSILDYTFYLGVPQFIYFFETQEVFKKNLFILLFIFIFGCVGSSLLHAGFLQLQRGRATLCCDVRASHCGGFCCCGARALERRLSSCSTQAQLLYGMWDLPGPGLEPVSPVLAGGFPTTAPPGKPSPIYELGYILKVNLWVGYLISLQK